MDHACYNTDLSKGIAHWGNSGMSITGVTNCFLTGFVGYSMGRNSYLRHGKPGQKPMAREFMGPRGTYYYCLLKACVVKVSPKYLCLYLPINAALFLDQRCFFLKWARVNAKYKYIHTLIHSKIQNSNMEVEQVRIPV